MWYTYVYSIFSSYCDSFCQKLSQYGEKILYAYVYHILCSLGNCEALHEITISCMRCSVYVHHYTLIGNGTRAYWFQIRIDISVFRVAMTMTSVMLIEPLKPLDYHGNMIPPFRAPWYRENRGSGMSGDIRLPGLAEKKSILVCKVAPLENIHWENYISISFHIGWDMTVVTVFL